MFEKKETYVDQDEKAPFGRVNVGVNVEVRIDVLSKTSLH